MRNSIEMKKADYKNRSKDELAVMLEEFRAKLLKLNFELEDKRIKDTSQVKKAKKEIARILTALKEINLSPGK